MIENVACLHNLFERHENANAEGDFRQAVIAPKNVFLILEFLTVSLNLG